MAQSAKYSEHKQRDLSLIPRIHFFKLGMEDALKNHHQEGVVE